MADDARFADFRRRIRAGDERAAEELIRIDEPGIRAAVRRRLERADLRRLFNSTDIAQCVLKSFFFRAAGGQYHFQKPTDLVKLLVRMGRNKITAGH